MVEEEPKHLRVLIANERRDRLELLAQVVAGLGHDVIAREIYVKEVGAATERERPDVALVGLGLSSEHALELIAEIVREASCPVIALLSAKDPAYVREAAKRGVFAYIVDGDAEELQSAIDITLQRFAEYQSLQGAFGRRAFDRAGEGNLDGATRDRRRPRLPDAARALTAQRPEAGRHRAGSRGQPSAPARAAAVGGRKPRARTVEPPAGVLGSKALPATPGNPLPFNRSRTDAPHRAADTGRRQSERTAASRASSRAVATQIVVSAAP